MRRLAAQVATLVLLAALTGLVFSCRGNQTASGQPPGANAAPTSPTAPSQEAKTMRHPSFAGPPGMGFYSDDPALLRKQIDGYLAQASLPEVPGDLVALMVPHAGHEYSGPVAAYSYRALKGKPISTVIFVGNSHRASFPGAALSPDDAWETPLGAVEVDRGIERQLAAQGAPFTESREAHAREHSIEVQLPFLQVVLPQAKIVPIMLSDFSRGNCEQVAHALAPLLKRADTVLIASSDMSHYPAHDDATRCDRATLDAIVSLDPGRICTSDEQLLRGDTPNLECTLCGLGCVVTAVMAAKEAGATKATVLKYANSGDTAPETRGRSVGYGAVAFTAPEGARGKAATGEAAAHPEATTELTKDEKVRLLRLARQTLEAHLAHGPEPSTDPQGSAALARPTACFVTLKTHGRLRGCIGELEAREPLISAVAHRAISAAEEDPRFAPVTARELSAITIEISAMSPLRQVASPDEIVVGKHGVVVRQGFRSGVFLPQVAPEQGWDRDTMLTVLCTEKAGLPGDAWKKGADLLVFTADVFGEEEMGLNGG